MDSHYGGDVNLVLHLPDPSEWTSDLVRRINDLSDHTLSGAIERGKRLDFGLRSKAIHLSKEGFAKAGVNLPVGLAKKLIELAVHKSYCSEGPLYLDQRRFGTRDGEQVIVDEIRQLFAEGNSSNKVANILNRRGTFSRDGKWNHCTIGRVIEHAERGMKPRNPCTCRMLRNDWEKPRRWSVCWHLLRLSDRMFEAMLKAGGIHADTTESDIKAFRRSRLFQPAAPPAIILPRSSCVLNQVVIGDCITCLSELPNGSVSCVITSPPYALQRWQYEGKAVADYLGWTVKWMEAVRPKLKEDGSVFIVIREHIEDGQISDYVYRTILALRDAGWKQPERMIWLKRDGGMGGAVLRPRRNFEDILWFSKTTRPFMDLRACGKPSDRIGMTNRNPHGNFHSDGGVLVDGVARVTDVITVGDLDLVVEAPVSGNDRGINHPARFPAEVVRPLIRTFAPPGSLIVDPFAGSGTTCLVAQSEGYDFFGCDNGREVLGRENGQPIYGEFFADIATRRLQTEPRYFRGQAIRDRSEANPNPCTHTLSEAERTKRTRRWLSFNEKVLAYQDGLFPSLEAFSSATKHFCPICNPGDAETLYVERLFNAFTSLTNN